LVSAARLLLFLRRVPIPLLAAVALLGATAAFHAPAIAQERSGFGWSLRDLLFPRRSERLEPPADIREGRPAAKPKKPRRSVASKPAEPKVPIVEKTDDAKVVLVVGDFLASGLSEGLDVVFAQNPAVKVVSRANGSSGFVRDDYYDWPGQIGKLIETEKPAAIVVMLGSNDRQSLRVGDVREQPRSDAWNKAYDERVNTFAKTVATHKIPFLWVGLPAFKASKMTSDMLAFNDIYRAAAEANGGEFVDIWDGFVDENGAFVTNGPDVNGQPVRLRSDDGINLTQAGKRKLAFYTEKPLLKVLGIASPSGNPAIDQPAGQPVEPATPKPSEAPAKPVVIDRTPPMLLSDPEFDGGSALLGAGPADHKAPERSPMATPASTAGRADDFSLKPAAASDTDTTTATAP